MIENYQDKNIEQTLESVSGFDASRLQQFLVFEREHKNRKGVISEIRDQLVTVEAPRQGYYNGFWFDDGGEHTVRDTRRLRRAVENTELEIVD